MNPTPAPEVPEAHGRPAAAPHDRGTTGGPLACEAPTVPRQSGGGLDDAPGRGPAAVDPVAEAPRPEPVAAPVPEAPGVTAPVPEAPGVTAPVPEAPRPAAVDPVAESTGARPGPAAGDHLDDPDPYRAADGAACENLVRCWVRERGIPAPAGDTLRIPLDASGTALRVPVRHWSAAGWHRFGPPVLEGSPRGAGTADAVTVAALLGREAGQAEGADLVGRVADSVRHTALFLAERRRRPAPPAHADHFLAAEQSLLLGHPLHPAPKSREGLSESEVRRYSPELHGAFALHWMAVDRSVLATDSAWTEQGRPLAAERLTARLAGGLAVPEGCAALPLHPWQARDLAHRPAVAALLDAGLLHDLGTHGEDWYPTSSVRTVHRPGAPVMLKLSLGVRITNSRRENLRKELHRGVEVHRLLRTGLGDRWRAAHPGFDIVRDPAWLGADAPGGGPVAGLDVVLRHNPFGPGDDAVCVAALTSPRPMPGREGTYSRLADVVDTLAARTGRPRAAVSAEWFLRYLDKVVLPVLWLDATAGIALEAHQQNTLVLLDAQGWPAGGRYRDNQGYYFRESHREALDRRLPGIGTASDTFVSDAVTDERFAYYLGINNILGLVGAFGSQGLADERVLLAALRRFLAAHTALGSPLPGRLLDADVLRSKANLLTRLRGLDELVGPVDTQSVYVALANPLHS
ncbi:IucA/IucC family protein [Streptomyces zhihengii]|uniref:IucA/IucC family protein n=1 Tax=Streptomyces zhihengii TaxID=1818004 RepID=UPI00363EF584